MAAHAGEHGDYTAERSQITNQERNAARDRQYTNAQRPQSQLTPVHQRAHALSEQCNPKRPAQQQETGTGPATWKRRE